MQYLSGTFTTILWLTFIGTTLSNVWTFALAYNYSDHKPGTTKDADFWFLMQSCITQGFTLIISGIPLRANPVLRKRTWVPPMLLALMCTIIAPPLYLTAPTEWSSFVCLIATGIQAFGSTACDGFRMSAGPVVIWLVNAGWMSCGQGSESTPTQVYAIRAYN
ncbi:hypothetical protein LB505_012012 [Fusarium chuoi]|nr:hypothetical protein LB505_012012 [Fusarium chuoi]